MPLTKTDSRVRFDAAAISAKLKIAAGVSIMTQRPSEAGAPSADSASSTDWTSAALEILGASTASGPAATAASRSAPPHGVVRPFTRITTSRGPYPPAFTASATRARASSLASGATASSRSRIKASAGNERAFSKALAFAPGM